MQAVHRRVESERYAKCVEASSHMRWDIDRDVFRGRSFDFSQRFLPDDITQVHRLPFLNADERCLLGQIQGRTYARMQELFERFIAAKVLEMSGNHALGHPAALEVAARSCEAALKHQELFRRVERMIAQGMPSGYAFLAPPNAIAAIVLHKSTWAVLALTCCVELSTQVQRRQSIEPDAELSGSYKDVVLFHSREKSLDAMLDEAAWIRENSKLGAEERNRAVSELVQLVRALNELLQLQADHDVKYFFKISQYKFDASQIQQLRIGVLSAYRWQHIVSGFREPHFSAVLGGMTTRDQAKRIGDALEPILW